MSIGTFYADSSALERITTESSYPIIPLKSKKRQPAPPATRRPNFLAPNDTSAIQQTSVRHLTSSNIPPSLIKTMLQT